jgi:hypothetical protein
MTAEGGGTAYEQYGVTCLEATSQMSFFKKILS